MPGKSKRRRNRGQEPGTPTRSAPPKQKAGHGSKTQAHTQYILEVLRDRPVGKGYLLKASLGEVNDFVRTIKAVAKGWTVLDPQIARKLLEYHAARVSSFLSPLNDLQREVFLRIVEGYEDEDILESGSLAPEGVDEHVNEIYERIGLSRDGQHQRRVEAVLAFLSQTMQGH